MSSHRESLRWPGSSTFRRLKTYRALTSRREFVGAACDYMGRCPAVCQVGAAEVED